MRVKKGGSFLTEETKEMDIFTPEDFTEEHWMIGKMTADFVDKRVIKNLAAMENHDFKQVVELLKEAGELGLLSGDIPEEFGGLGLDKISSAIISEKMSIAGGFSVTHGAHIGIGSLPIVLFGNKEQKEKYLPYLATGEKIAAYALTEPQAGSDAMSIRTTAALNEEGTHYILKGEKQWITNAGIADVFTVFAKIDGKDFSAFIIEREFEGFSIGKEENKLGIKSSSTCALKFDNVAVPVENLLGEKGKGHIIALNILNIGRFKLGVGAVGASKEAIKKTISYTNNRIQFHTPITQFPLTKEKLATMSAYLYAAESSVYRTAGLISTSMSPLPHDADRKLIASAINEYAIECSLNKVFASEVLDMIVDECVQLHGGNGFMEGYDITRMYRDARINRIFEGTNEINRLLVPATLLKKGIKGELPLLQAAKNVERQLLTLLPADPEKSILAQEKMFVENGKKIALLLLGLTAQKFGHKLENEQEILANLSNIIMTVYNMESAILRTEKGIKRGQNNEIQKILYTEIYCAEAFQKINSEAIEILANMESGDNLRLLLASLKKLTRHLPKPIISLKRKAAEEIIAKKQYIV
ncbi:acyl-CoA dehydrogenase family protein [Niallia nealsonii]|uniref:Acyl-CoA dehydrogenase n=1 Tax=Niallia nealsonii TaxID=115979 RepID=A0A2N0Z238_9BACI|nr:acyl-CoA dehydrogenase family protein [Niallia nealsonii]PKG23581.1 acyl-CoA dehydrogenase [Niallia nealsonii]